MADRGFYYGSLGRQEKRPLDNELSLQYHTSHYIFLTALASSYSTLDGVPFKIATKFRPLPKVISLPVLEGSGTCSAFDEEYTFETEEGVLAWARDVDEANQRAKQEEAEKALKREAALKQNETSTDSESDDSVQNDQNIPNPHANHGDERVQVVTHNDFNKQSPLTVPAVPAKPPPPKPAPRLGSILKPTPIQPVNKSSDGNESISGKPAEPPSVSSERFDITMFEQEADPFENLELQTINDMEELKVLLDSSSNLASSGEGNGNPEQCNGTNQMNIPVSGSDNATNTSEGFYELAGPIKTSAWVTFDNMDPTQSHGSPAFSSDLNMGGPMVSSSESSASEGGDYVKLIPGEALQSPITSKPNQNGSIVQPSSEQTANLSTQQGNQNPFGSQLPTHLASSGLFKPVLPPIPKPRQPAVNETASDNVMSQTLSDQANPFVPGPSLPRSTQENTVKTVHSYLNDTNKSNGLKPARIAPPPPVSKPTPAAFKADISAKMWSSVGPSLANSMEDANKTNPYSRHSREWHGASKSPDVTQGKNSPPVPADKLTQSSSSSQLWNRYRPLPPAPSPSPNPPDPQLLPQWPPSQSIGLTDPYYSLSKEAQAFTDRITSMGFLRAKVARAVEKFGQDEKEVLDHLIAVDMLVQKKFAPVFAELALHSCRNDCEKAERFLTMQSQFEELGFTSEKVQDALIKSDMDHDKALDLLTACSP